MVRLNHSLRYHYQHTEHLITGQTVSPLRPYRHVKVAAQGVHFCYLGAVFVCQGAIVA